jgi:beta-glucosidase
MPEVDAVLGQLTVDEKVSLCSGFGPWSTKKIEHLGVDPVFMSDGPHGARWMKTQDYTQRSEWDMSSLASFTTKSGYLDLLHPVTNFPSLAALGSSWDTELMCEVGRAIGEECRELGIGLLLAPGVNIVRHPLCGRAYEYLSEDPVVAGELGAAYIMGVQSTGVGATVKHFVCNNAEFERLSMDSIVEERALREIYLATFERIVKNAKPSMVMESYNKVNGTSMVENRRLLTDILKGEWGFEGVVISDWWAVNDRVDSFNAGMDLEMPQNPLNDQSLLNAVKDGTVSKEQLDDSCRRILSLITKHAGLEKVKSNYEKHHKLARRAAAESIVLLKNEGGLLPLDPQSKIAVAGSFAVNPRYQGVGCSIVNPRELLIPLTEIERKAENTTYSTGYDEEHNTNTQLIKESVRRAKESDCVILFVGLPEEVETETHDREDYNIPLSHIKLIKEVSAANPNTVVVLQNGSAVSMAPWMDNVSAILEGWLGGEAGAGALADVIFGETNPSGKLAVSFPEKIEDTPGYLNFPGENGRHIYSEGIFVGYRYYEKKKINPTFPFGFGLSYTQFKYNNLKLDKESMTNEGYLNVGFTVSNIGERAGKEIAQIYIKPHTSKLKRPEKELKKFIKIPLEPGESKTVNVTVSERDFAYYHDSFKEWVVDSGTYTLMVGASSDDIRLTADVMVESSQVSFAPLTGESYCYNLVDNPVALVAFKEIMVRNNLWGEEVRDEFFEAIRHNFIPLFKSITRQTGGKISREEFDSWMDEVNEKILEAIKGTKKAYNSN